VGFFFACGGVGADVFDYDSAGNVVSVAPAF